MGKTKEPKEIYQVKISLDRISPPIWRRVLTPDVSLELLHHLIQRAMGWDNDHAYQFLVDRRAFVDPGYADGEDNEDAGQARLSQIARGWKRKFKYLYDFGDNWRHIVEVEGRVARQAGMRYPVCIAGQNRCPPEDVGGVMRYRYFVEAINDPNDPGHGHWKEWWPEPFDPEEFDLDVVNRRLGQMTVE